MRLTDVDAATEVTFLHCLHDERPDDPRVLEMRRKWLRDTQARGLRAKLLLRDDGAAVGMCQAMPIEHTHLVGRDLLAVLCIWVHGYRHLVGNQQGQGYGRTILEALEADARASGFLGVAAWGMDFPHWNPVSFYEHMGYARVDRDGAAVLVWKPFTDAARPPSFLRQARRPVGGPNRVSLAAFGNGSCMGVCQQVVAARDAAVGLEGVADYIEVDTSDREALSSWGISGGIFLDGEPLRPNEPPPTSEVIRRDVLDAAGRRGLPAGKPREG
jgi:GNAT superfamily N-acetyltransferase